MSKEKTEIVYEIRRADGHKVCGSMYEDVAVRDFKRIRKFVPDDRLIKITRAISITEEDITPL